MLYGSCPQCAEKQQRQTTWKIATQTWNWDLVSLCSCHGNHIYLIFSTLSFHIQQWKRFYLFEQQSYRYRSSFHWFISQISQPRSKPGTPSRPPLWEVRAQAAGPSSAAFLSILAGCWIGNEAARTWTVSTGECEHSRQHLNPLCHSTSYHILSIFPLSSP